MRICLHKISGPTLPDPIINLIHIQILNIWGKDPVEQLEETLSIACMIRMLDTYNIQYFFARVQPPHVDAIQLLFSPKYNFLVLARYLSGVYVVETDGPMM